MYAKNPKENFTTINLKEIIDVKMQQDPKHYLEKKARSEERSSNNFNSVPNK